MIFRRRKTPQAPSPPPAWKLLSDAEIVDAIAAKDYGRIGGSMPMDNAVEAICRELQNARVTTSPSEEAHGH